MQLSPPFHKPSKCFVLAFAFLLGLARPGLTRAWGAAPSEKPNVIFILTDDQGYGDLSCTGNPVLRTPALDTLYRQSVRLTDYHVSPTCSPTRGALMSGHYANHAGTWHTVAGRSILKEGELTMGQVFESGGYATGMFGKWHLGDNYPFRPEDRGFQEVVRHGGGGVGQTPDYWNNASFDDTYFHNGKPQKYHGFSTDVFFGEAKRFIAESHARGVPFFVYLATSAAHSPFVCPEKYWKGLVEAGVAKQTAVFLGMIANIDENVGRLREWLADQRLEKNTILIFSSDNGTAAGQTVYNAGMSGHKGSALDGGHRVPFFLYWPAGGFDKAEDVNRLTAHIDILPTLIDLCGLKKPANYEFDGRSLVPLLRNPGGSWPDRVIVTDSQRVQIPIKWRDSAVMTDDWRLINGERLYAIKKDPGEKNDLAKQDPAEVAKLRDAYEQWWANLVPGFDEYARIHIGDRAANPVNLTCHDWHNPNRGIPWHQGFIRTGYPETGYWAVRVADADWYDITLRRWPPELGAAIDADVPPGKPVPGLETFREKPGIGFHVAEAEIKAAGVYQRKPVKPGQKSVTFRVKLEKGDQFLSATFIMAGPGNKRIGAYYVEVNRLSLPE